MPIPLVYSLRILSLSVTHILRDWCFLVAQTMENRPCCYRQPRAGSVTHSALNPWDIPGQVSAGMSWADAYVHPLSPVTPQFRVSVGLPTGTEW